MLSRSGRPFATWLFRPFVKAAVALHVSANQATVVGSVLSASAAIGLLATDHLALGAWVVTFLVIFDSLDGQIARATNTTSSFGAFLDATMDRMVDGTIFGSLIVWSLRYGDPRFEMWTVVCGIAALTFALTTSYAKARAEAQGLSANVGWIERTDRLVVLLLTAFLTGVGAGDHWIMDGMVFLAAAGFVTVVQRMRHVYRQFVARESPGQGR
ncbi:MAG: CDP-alcohol phosphatidyltransferase family protein [Actinomycetaceae bacterium]|nr:CDP-alcohol phosphatidyltransferase family protein [Actinomycetaceae bacterium]MDY6083273.1 CDP-alcohol phosphatidyltransferase family protein [Actinomycetaceae bacterium]